MYVNTQFPPQVESPEYALSFIIMSHKSNERQTPLELTRLANALLTILCLIVIPVVSANSATLTHPLEDDNVLWTDYEDIFKGLDDSLRFGADNLPPSFFRIYRDGSPVTSTGAPPLTLDVPWIPVSDDVIMIEVPVGDHAGSPGDTPLTPALLFYDE